MWKENLERMDVSMLQSFEQNYSVETKNVVYHILLKQNQPNLEQTLMVYYLINETWYLTLQENL